MTREDLMELIRDAAFELAWSVLPEEKVYDFTGGLHHVLKCIDECPPGSDVAAIVDHIAEAVELIMCDQPGDIGGMLRARFAGDDRPGPVAMEAG